MKFVIYPGSDGNIQHFRDFCNQNSIKFYEERDLIGEKFKLEADFDFKDDLFYFISEYIVEEYLKDYILCKIYDEYPCIDFREACSILNELIDDFSKQIGVNLNLNEKCKLNLPNYVLFNIKQIMLTINSLVDKLCLKHYESKNKETITALINRYSALFGFETSEDDF